MNLETAVNNIEDAVKATFKTKKRAAAFFILAAASYSLLILASFPTYSIQMSEAGINYFFIAIQALTVNTYKSTGFLGLALTFVYAVITGVSLVNIGVQLKMNSFDLGGFASIAPGFLASGCASCGVGLLGFLGFTGALAAMPFNGNLVRIGGIGLLVFFLGKSGDPETCAIGA